MRIGIVCPYNIFRHGGVQEVIHAQYQVLTERGHHVRIISPRPISYDQEPPDHIKLIGMSTDLNYPFKTKADISIKVGQSEIRELLEEEDFDVLHFHEPWVPIFPRQLLNLSTSINVATFHAKWPEQLIYRTFGKAIKPYARSIVDDLDYIVAASEPGSHYINDLLGRDVPIIYLGIDLERFNPAVIKPYRRYRDGTKTILYINRLEKRKGPDLLLFAYQKLLQQMPDVRLLIGSDGDMRSKLEDYVHLYNLPRVEFLGFVSDEDKVRLYASADVYTAPSPYGEGFGVVILEAMAMGVPYIAGDNPGYRSASGDRADMYTVDPYDAEAYANALHKMLLDEPARSDYKQWAATRVAQFDNETMVDQYLEIYTRLLSDS